MLDVGWQLTKSNPRSHIHSLVGTLGCVYCKQRFSLVSEIPRKCLRKEEGHTQQSHSPTLCMLTILMRI